jgi:hypothetical protein
MFLFLLQPRRFTPGVRGPHVPLFLFSSAAFRRRDVAGLPPKVVESSGHSNCERETMNDNPARSREEQTLPCIFYTDDITLLPTRAIWQFIRRRPIRQRVFLFIIVLVRKALNRRFPANHGMARPEEVIPLCDDELPPNVREAFTPFVRACHEAGMSLVCNFRSLCIGNKRGFHSVWLDPRGVAYLDIFWLHLRVGQLEKSDVRCGCHSRLTSGVILHTAPLAPEYWIPEFAPPNHDLMRLAADAPPCEVIDRHRERIANRSDLVRFDANSLLKEIIHTGQEVVDFLVEKGILSPLTEAEIQRFANSG